MRTNDRMSDDDSGTSVLVEYLFMIIIMAIFFSLTVLLLESMINDTNRVIVGQELGIVASNTASRIAGFSDKVTANTYGDSYWSNDISGFSESIDLPDMIGGKSYSLTIEYDITTLVGNVTVTYSDNVDINRTVAFRSATRVAGATIASTDASPKIYYDPARQAIEVTGN